MLTNTITCITSWCESKQPAVTSLCFPSTSPPQGNALRIMFTSSNNVIQSTAGTRNSPKDTVHVLGIPAVSIQNARLQVGDARSSMSLPSSTPSPKTSPTGSHRSYTPIKTLGDGSFGTVLLCDWHGTLPPNTPLSPMQCGGGARPEWAGKRLVAVKRMKKKWEGGWDECKRLKELEVRFHSSSSSSSSP